MRVVRISKNDAIELRRLRVDLEKAKQTFGSFADDVRARICGENVGTFSEDYEHLVLQEGSIRGDVSQERKK